jgi:hypothetical protein
MSYEFGQTIFPNIRLGPHAAGSELYDMCTSQIFVNAEFITTMVLPPHTTTTTINATAINSQIHLPLKNFFTFTNSFPGLQFYQILH